MKPPPDPPEATTSVQFTVEGDQFNLAARVSVPTGPIRVSDLLPMARGMSDQIVHETVKAVEAAGLKISCCKGQGLNQRHPFKAVIRR